MPAYAVNPRDLVGLAVPGIAALEKPARHPHDHGCRKTVLSAPPHGAAIIELLRRRVGVLAELDFRHRQKPRERHADGAADDTFLGQAGIEHPLDTVLVLQTQRGTVHTALGAHIL